MRANGGGRSRAPQGRSRLKVPAARAVTNSVLSEDGSESLHANNVGQ
jgi:hypothetical protein